MWLPIAAFGAELAATITGFGAATLFLPFALLALPAREAVVVTALFHFVGNLAKGGIFRRTINWRLALTFGIPSVVATAVGAWFLGDLSTAVLRRLIGAVLILAAIIEWRAESLRLPARATTATVAGAVAGGLAGLTGVGGALRGVVLLTFQLPREVYIGTGAAIAIMTDLSRNATYLLRSTADVQPRVLIPVLIAAVVGTLLGRKLLQRITVGAWRTVVLLALLGFGIYYLDPA